MSIVLTCREGHQWEVDQNQAAPQPSCPVCGGLPETLMPPVPALSVSTRMDDVAPLTPGGAPEVGAPVTQKTTGVPILPPGELSVAGVRYLLGKILGEGGQGEVYRAKDTELHREVALKRIKAKYAHDDETRRRFLVEAEVTARLEHPGVVPVYALAHDEAGQPCYAMRFIQGDSLADAIKKFHGTSDDRERRGVSPPVPATGGLTPRRSPGFDSLEFRQLLQRFIAVCNTIAYAHSRGVIHRDIKPGNIMLGKYGETLVVDWGLAKIVGRDETTRQMGEDTLRPTTPKSPGSTAPGEAMGTPAYMSPEQAAGAWDQVGPASDLYSLGATLYALLTNQPPITGRALPELQMRIQRGDYPRPRALNRAIPPALEAICLRAMALRPEARYATALDLAHDLEHWLADEPVTTYAEPISVKVGRWMRKHKALLATAAAALFTATIGLAIGLFVVNAEKDRTELARQGEEQQRIEAQTQEAVTRAVLDFVENKVFAAARPKDQEGGMGYDVKLADAVKQALPFVDKSFTDQPLIAARLRLTLGASFSYLGEAKTAAEQFQAARALYTKHRGPDHPDTLASMNNLAVCYRELGRHADALKLHEETLALSKAKLGPDHPKTLSSMSNLANSYETLGRHADALKLREETLALSKAKLGPDHPDTLLSKANLANSYVSLGRHADALKLREETLALMKAKLGPDHPDTLKSMSNLAVSYSALGRHADALKLSEATLALRKATLGPDHPDTLTSMSNLADSYSALGRHTDALKLSEATLALSKAKLGPDHPDTLASMGSLATMYYELGRHADALKLCEEMLELQKAKLGPDHPDTLASMGSLATMYYELGRHDDALKLCEEMLELQKAKLGPDHPDTLASMSNLAVSYSALGRHADALKLSEATLALSRAKLGPDHPDTLLSMGNLADSLTNLDRAAEAVPLIDECLKRAAEKAVHPRLIPTVMDLRLRHFAKTYDAAGCRQTAEMWEKLNRTDAESLYNAACMRSVTAAVIKQDSKTPGADAARLAQEEGDRAMAWLKQAVAAGYKNVAHMNKDKDLDALRDRADFQQLLTALGAKPPAAPVLDALQRHYAWPLLWGWPRF